MAEINQYAGCLADQGNLILSGFYLHDLDDIRLSCAVEGMAYHHHITKNNWVAAHFVK